MRQQQNCYFTVQEQTHVINYIAKEVIGSAAFLIQFNWLLMTSL